MTTDRFRHPLTAKPAETRTGNRPPLVITIPIQIARGLTPNGRVHWRIKARLVREAHETTHWAMHEVVDLNDPYECFQTSQWPLTLHYVIGHGKGRQKLDDDNAIGAMKALRDAIASALGIDDKHLVTGSMSQVRDPDKRGFVKVAIEPAEAESEQAA